MRATITQPPNGVARALSERWKGTPMSYAEPATYTPRFAAPITEDVLTGKRKLRSQFLQTPLRFAAPRTPLIAIEHRNPPAILLRNGFAFRACCLANGRRAILHLLITGDFAGFDHVILERPIEEIVAVGRVSYHALSGSEIRELMSDRSIAVTMLALCSEDRWRSDRLVASI